MIEADRLPPGWEPAADDERGKVCDALWINYMHRDGAPPHPLLHIRVPQPFVTYAIGRVLADSEPPWTGSVNDFYEKTFEAFRSLTASDGFLYVADTDYQAYRFWPHRASASDRWPLGIPGSMDSNEAWESFVIPTDFSWVFSAEAGHDLVVLSGSNLIDAFERSKPELFRSA